MTSHAESHSAEVAHVDHGSGADPRLQLASSLKFEPSELHDFDMADRQAGQMMGKLLAFLFCVLFVLMSGVNLWMEGQKDPNFDPKKFGSIQDPQKFGNTDVSTSSSPAVHH